MIWFFQRHSDSDNGYSQMSYEAQQAMLAALDEILQNQRYSLQNQRETMADLSNLQAALAANTQVISDIQAEVAALKAASGTDQAAIDALTAQLTTNNAAMEALKPPPPPPVTAPST